MALCLLFTTQYTVSVRENLMTKKASSSSLAAESNWHMILSLRSLYLILIQSVSTARRTGYRT
jgi:hypothetical protein